MCDILVQNPASKTPKNIQIELGLNGTKSFNALIKKAVNNWYERISHNNTP